LLEHALQRRDLATVLVDAVEEALVTHPTADMGGRATTTAFGDAVLASLERRLPLEEGKWTSALS
jgi:isocitrate/isopropylmalate dehydrogenase